MQVGIFCSSNKPYLWDRLYKSLSKNNVDFNLCIAGPNPPMESLPGNVKYIQTNVKPAQCYFIASHNTIGDYVMSLNDDIILSPGCLDNLVKLADNKMTIASPQFLLKQKGDDLGAAEKINHRILSDPRGYPQNDPRSISPDKKVRKKFITLCFPLPIGSMMRKETFDSLGGFDKYFIYHYWELDMAFELISRGGTIIISEIGFQEEFPEGKVSLSRMACDYHYLISMWLDDGSDKIRDKRKNLVDSLVYSDDVLKVSQGVKIPVLPPSYSNRKKEMFLAYAKNWT